MNVKLRVLSAGVMFFIGHTVSAQVDTTKVADIEEVVIVNTGYTALKKEQVTGSVASVKAKDIENVPGATVQQALVGKLAGVDISFGSGSPGSGNFRMDIRGVQTINGSSDALYLVDGIPISANAFQLLDPNSFETMDVVKDYGTAAQFGASGGAGIIVVTTKKGKNRSKANVTYTGQTGISTRANDKITMMDSRQWHTFRRDINLGNPYTGKDYTNADIESLSQINTNWKDYILQHGVFNQHNLEIVGGADKFSYYTNLGYFSQEGVIKGSGMDRFTGVFNMSADISDRLKVDFNNNISYGIRDNIYAEGDLVLTNPIVAMYMTPPSDLPYLPDGRYNTGNGKLGGNTLEIMEKRLSRNQTFRLVSGMNAKYKLTDYLSVQQRVGLDFRNSNGEVFMPPNIYQGTIIIPGNKGHLSRSNSQVSSIFSNTGLTFDKWFGNDRHHINAMAMYEYFGKHLKSFSYVGFGLDDLYFNSPTGVVVGQNTLPNLGGGSSHFHRMAYIGIFNYTFDDKYTFNASIRRESASNFGENFKWGTFFGAGLAWQMHKENFMKSLTFVNSFKPRVSYGEVGNPMDPETGSMYGTAKNYGSGTYNNLPALAPTTAGNPNFKWEVGKELTAGVEFGLFSNFVTGSFDVYNRRTVDLYLSKTLSSTSGFSSIGNFNSGEMVNKGIETQLNFNLIRNRDFKWSVFGNIAVNKNEIVSLGEVNEYELGTSIIKVGLPFGSHYAVGWAGVDPSNGQPLYYDKNGNVTNVYSDDNNVANFGSYMPEIIGGFGTEVSYKGFTLSTLFKFKDKYYRFNNESYMAENPAMAQYNQSTKMLDMWKTPGQVTEVQSYIYQRQFSSKDIEDASFLRLQEVRLSYKVPKAVLGDFVQGIDLFVVGNNLYTWTKWTGLDPDDSNNIGTYEYPFSRTITVGAKINF